MWPKLSLVAALASTASALLVAPNSPCSQYCGNVLSSTTGSDMTCSQSSYSSSAAGIVFETCIDCELKSTYSSGNQSDLAYLIYNLRYAISYCLFGLENNTNVQDTPCITSRACGPLENAFDWRNMSTSVGAYDFCQGWIEDFVPSCTECLDAGSMNYIMNFVTILDAACRQMPSVGSTLSVAGTPFSTIPMNVTTPSATSLYTYTPSHSVIPLGGKVGIAIGGLVLILSVAGFLIVCLGRRRRRAYLKSVASRYNGKRHMGWPSPPVGGNSHDTTDTPMSQKPLRGWDDHSPVSAGTVSERGEKNGFYPRYFSPYSSQYNSPVSAEDGTAYAWPTLAHTTAGFTGSGEPLEGQPGPSSAIPNNYTAHDYTQEEIDQMARERQLAQIGVALGGSDPSLRSKNSNVSLGAAHESLAPPQASFQPAPVQGVSPSLSSLSSLSVSAGALWEKAAKSKAVATTTFAGTTATMSSRTASSPSNESTNESYELREIDSNGQPAGHSPSAAAPPMLQHPGYGRAMRYYPRPPDPRMEEPLY